MTDHRTRLASREPMTAEEEAEDLLRRQRAGLIRQVDVGPCSACPGDGWGVPPSRTIDLGHKVVELTPKDGPLLCPACNGTGRRYRSGLELAAYCGHEAARLALGHVGLTATLRYARADEDYRAWWECLRVTFGEDVYWLAIGEALRLAYRAAGVPENPATSPTWLPRVAAQASRIATGQAKAALIRWALTEP